MTIEEKLSKAKDFIKSIADMQLSIMTSSDIVSELHVYCEDCGEECELDCTGIHATYVDAKELKNLKDQAWHLLADLTD